MNYNNLELLKESNTRGMATADKAEWIAMQLEDGKRIAFMGTGRRYSYPDMPSMYVENLEGKLLWADEKAQKGKKMPFPEIEIPRGFIATRAKIGGWGSNASSSVVAIWTNPQFNRCFALLEDGNEVDYDLSILEIVWNDFEIYKPVELPKEMTLSEIEAKLGCKVKIVNK